jgi:hypothetical protein
MVEPIDLDMCKQNIISTQPIHDRRRERLVGNMGLAGRAGGAHMGFRGTRSVWEGDERRVLDQRVS